MQTNVAVGLTSLKNQIQRLELKDANLSPECTKSRHVEIKFEKFRGAVPPPHTPVPSAP